MVGVPQSSVPIIQQLHEWAAANGVLLFPRAYPFPTLQGTLSSANRQVQPDGGFIAIAIAGLSFVIGNTRVSLDNLQSGARKLVDGTPGVRLAAFISTLESDGINALYLAAPILVFPGNFLTYSVSCEVAGENFDNGGGAGYETSVMGYGLFDINSGTMLPEDIAAAKLAQLMDDLGELRLLGVSGSTATIDASASPMKPMSCEVIAAQGIAPATVTASRLTLGTTEIIPTALALPSSLLSFRAPGLMMNPNTKMQLRVTAPGAVRAHACIAGRSLGG